MERVDLWQEFAAGSTEARELLLDEHLGLVHHVAKQLSRNLASNLEFDDLVSSGVIGLMNAVESFDPSRGIAFSTFATPRIRGAILDDLRRQDHVSRTVRKKSRDIHTATELLTRRYGFLPTDAMVAEELDADMETLWRWKAEVEGIFHLPMDMPTAPGEQDSPTFAEILTGEEEFSVEEELNRQEEETILREALLGLKEKERLVVSLYYLEELKLHEIAKILELTESRISQIRSQAIRKLRLQLGDLLPVAA